MIDAPTRRDASTTPMAPKIRQLLRVRSFQKIGRRNGVSTAITPT